MHFSKQFIQTALYNVFPAKACNLLKILSSSLRSKCLWTYQCHQNEKSLSFFTNKIVKMLSHVVNITVHSVTITWCKLWRQFGWHLLYWNAEGFTSYVCHISITNVQIYTLLYVGYWLFLNVWIIEDMVNLPIFSCTRQPLLIVFWMFIHCQNV